MQVDEWWTTNANYSRSSSQSCDRIISVDWSVSRILVVDTFPLVVVEMLYVCSTMNNGLPHVHEEEQWHYGEGDSCPVSRETNVEVAIALVRGKG